MELVTETKSNVLVVEPKEKRLDAKVAVDFKQKLINLINDSNKRILINLNSVDFVDSSGLGAIVSGLKAVGKNGELKITSPKDQVKNMFELTRLNLVFNIFENEDTALNSFN